MRLNMGSQRTSLSIAMRVVVPALLCGALGCGNEVRDAFVTEAVASCEAASDRVAAELAAYTPGRPGPEALAMSCAPGLFADEATVRQIEADFDAIHAFDGRVDLDDRRSMVYEDLQYDWLVFVFEGDVVDRAESDDFGWPAVHAELRNADVPERIRYDERNDRTIAWTPTRVPVRATDLADAYACMEAELSALENGPGGCSSLCSWVTFAETENYRWYRYRSSSEGLQHELVWAVSDDGVAMAQEDCWDRFEGDREIWADFCLETWTAEGLGEPIGLDDVDEPVPTDWCGGYRDP